jgi:hypothetical protein
VAVRPENGVGKRVGRDGVAVGVRWEKCMGRKGGESTSRCLRDSYRDTNERYYVIYRGNN